MPAPIKTYNPSDINLILASSYRVGGIVSLEVSFSKERFTMIPCIKGKNVRVRNKDTSCLISVELLQTSIANDVLSELVVQDSLVGTGRLTVSLGDSSGSTKIESRNAYVVGFPPVSYSNDIATRTWQIQLLDTNITLVGGNAVVRPKFLEDAIGFISGAASSVVSNIF